MNMMKMITSRANPVFRQWKKLAESQRERKKTGETLLEGMHLLTAWQLAYALPAQVWVSEKGRSRAEIAAWLQDNGDNDATEIFCSPDGLFNELADTDSPGGILARVHQPAPPAPPALNCDTLLLDGVQDPGNLGCLLRTAAAAGFSQALLSTGSAHAWSPKVLRAAQGAHFQLSLYESADLPTFLRDFQGESLAATLTEATPLCETFWSPDQPLAWIFGAEGQGVSATTLAAARQRVFIAMPGAMESLNVSAAAAICLFESLRRRGCER